MRYKFWLGREEGKFPSLSSPPPPPPPLQKGFFLPRVLLANNKKRGTKSDCSMSTDYGRGKYSTVFKKKKKYTNV